MIDPLGLQDFVKKTTDAIDEKIQSGEIRPVLEQVNTMPWDYSDAQVASDYIALANRLARETTPNAAAVIMRREAQLRQAAIAGLRTGNASAYYAYRSYGRAHFGLAVEAVATTAGAAQMLGAVAEDATKIIRGARMGSAAKSSAGVKVSPADGEGPGGGLTNGKDFETPIGEPAPPKGGKLTKVNADDENWIFRELELSQSHVDRMTPFDAAKSAREPIRWVNYQGKRYIMQGNHRVQAGSQSPNKMIEGLEYTVEEWEATFNTTFVPRGTNNPKVGP